MPRVHYVKKARKDNPVAKAGEPYYWWKFRYGGKRYSATRPTRSQLTQSPYYAAQFDAEDLVADNLASVANAVREGEYDDDDIQAAVSDALQPIVDAGNENADGLEESAESIEDGFGHETYQSEQLKERAEEYRQWAEEAETWGDLHIEGKPEDDDELQDWRDAVADEIEAIDYEYQGG